MKRRVLILLAAFVLAGFSALAIVAYGRSADERALQGRAGRWVLIATGAIPANTTINDIRTKGLVRRVLMPADTVPDGALSDLNTDLKGLKVNTALYPDQIVMNGVFSAAGAPTSSPKPTFDIPADKLAVSVDLGMAPQVAGNIGQGDKVSVFVTYPKTDSKDRPQKTIALLPVTTVISVGESPTHSATPDPTASPTGLVPTVIDGSPTTPAEPLKRYVVTLAVNQDEAELLVWGYNSGNLHLGMLGAKASVSPPANLAGLVASIGSGVGPSPS